LSIVSGGLLSKMKDITGDIVLFKRLLHDIYLLLEINDINNIEILSNHLKILWKENYNHEIKDFTDNVFVEVATLISVNKEKPGNNAFRYSKLLKEVFGEDNGLISDYYLALSVAFDNEGDVDQALDYAGRALLIRVDCFGVLSGKTAESHFILGLLFLKKEHLEEAKREITSSKTILCI
jgi:hypothetical protein